MNDYSVLVLAAEVDRLHEENEALREAIDYHKDECAKLYAELTGETARSLEDINTMFVAALTYLGKKEDK